MNIALIVNFILAAIAVGIFLKFLSDRKSARIHMEHYEDELHSEIAKRKEIELQYQNQIQSLKNNTRANITSQPANNAEAKSMVDSLVLEINKLRTEKEQELKSRLEAEKQID